MVSILIFGFISGIFLGSFGFATWSYVFLILLLGIIILGYSFFMEKEQKRLLFFVLLFCLGLFLGLFRMHFSNAYEKSTLDQYAEQNIFFTGVVVSEPDVREGHTKLTVKLKSVQTKTETFSLTEKIIISVSIYPEFSYGDLIGFKAKLVSPKNIESEEGRIFDYVGYLRVREIWYTASFVSPELISHNNGNPIKAFLFKIKKNFTEAINRALPEPESSLMSGLLLGAKQSLGKDLLLEFNKTGVSHIVVLSGYNIAIVAESIISFLSFLPKTFSFSFGCLGIILFTILSGGSASAVRASIMVLIALFAKKFNRDYKAGRALGLAIILMLTPNPLLLVFDPSFELSVLATIGIIYVSPIIGQYFLWVTKKFGLREIVSSTIATQITVLPFLIYNTGLLSLVSLPVNILILGTIPLTMFLGFLTGLFGLASYYFSFVPAIFAYLLLKYQLVIIHSGSILSLGSINLPSFSPFVVIIIYIIVLVILYLLKYGINLRIFNKSV